MDKLQPDIRVFEPRSDFSSRRTRISINSGTLQASEAQAQYSPYCKQAFVPREPWREPTPDERETLWSKNIPSEPGKWISIIRIPDDVLAPFERIQAATCKNEQLVTGLRNSPESRRGIEKFIDYITPLSASTEQPFEGAGISVRSPNLKTGTFDYKTDCYVGLHLDGWYKRPLDERHLSPNRICVNLGLEDRYFLFINLSLQTIYGLSDMDRSTDPSTLGASFMKHYPLYPVIRVRIATNEAYIAPTENIVHDGSTEGRASLDLCLTVRGDFKSCF